MSSRLAWVPQHDPSSQTSVLSCSGLSYLPYLLRSRALCSFSSDTPTARGYSQQKTL